MTYIVTGNCIKCEYIGCLELSPIDWFYAGENKLVIHPDESLDFGVCGPECPADAIRPDTEPALEGWVNLNREHSVKWPNITSAGPPPAVARERDGVPGKLGHFSPAPHDKSAPAKMEQYASEIVK